MYGIAQDESGAVLPGVNATLTSEFGTRTSVTGPDGAFRFLNLEKGDYTRDARPRGLRFDRPQDPDHHG